MDYVVPGAPVGIEFVVTAAGIPAAYNTTNIVKMIPNQQLVDSGKAWCTVKRVFTPADQYFPPAIFNYRVQKTEDI